MTAGLTTHMSAKITFFYTVTAQSRPLPEQS